MQVRCLHGSSKKRSQGGRKRGGSEGQRLLLHGFAPHITLCGRSRTPQQGQGPELRDNLAGQIEPAQSYTGNGFTLGLPALTNKNTRHSVKFEFQINNQHFFFKWNIIILSILTHCFSETQISLGILFLSGSPALHPYILPSARLTSLNGHL